MRILWLLLTEKIMTKRISGMKNPMNTEMPRRVFGVLVVLLVASAVLVGAGSAGDDISSLDQTHTSGVNSVSYKEITTAGEYTLITDLTGDIVVNIPATEESKEVTITKSGNANLTGQIVIKSASKVTVQGMYFILNNSVSYVWNNEPNTIAAVNLYTDAEGVVVIMSGNTINSSDATTKETHMFKSHGPQLAGGSQFTGNIVHNVTGHAINIIGVKDSGTLTISGNTVTMNPKESGRSLFKTYDNTVTAVSDVTYVISENELNIKEGNSETTTSLVKFDNTVDSDSVSVEITGNNIDASASYYSATAKTESSKFEEFIVKDGNGNIILVENLDQVIDADTKITWNNNEATISGATTNENGNVVLPDGTKFVEEDGTSVSTSTTDVTLGSGTETDPYLISTKDQLRELANAVNGGNTYAGKYIKLIADINLNNEVWTPIGTGTNSFKGTFDGNNKVISNLKISNGDNYVGLFGRTEGAVLKNVTLKNVDITGKDSVGSLAGNVHTSPAFVENCHVKGLIKVTGNHYVGGLIGHGYLNLKDCTVTGDAGSYVTGVYQAKDLEGDTVGGLIGQVQEDSYPGWTVTNCHAKIDVTGTRKVGGLIGLAHYGTIVSDSTSSGTVTLTYVSGYSDSFDPGEGAVGSLIGVVYPTNEVTASSSSSDVIVDPAFAQSNHGDVVSAGLVGSVRDSNSNYNEQTAVDDVAVTTSTWTPSATSYEALQAAGYLKLEGMSDEFKVAEPVTPPTPSKPSSSSSSSGSSVWLTETPTQTPTPTPSETATPTDSVPTDIPVTQPTEEPSSPGFGILAALAGLGAVAVIRRK